MLRPVGAGAHLGPPPQTAALPHRHRGLRGPVTPLRDPASFRSARDQAGRGRASPRLGDPHRGAQRCELVWPAYQLLLAGAPTWQQAPADSPAPPCAPSPRFTWAHR